MTRLKLLLLSSLYVCYSQAWGQCSVSKDRYGQIVTTCDVYRSVGSQNQIDTYRRVNYLSSPYLTFPGTRKGKIRLDESGQEIACEIAYDVVTNEVMCQFAGDLTAKTITPYSFTIDSLAFIRQMSTVLGVDYKIYAAVLYDGPTKLLRTLTRQLVQSPIPNDYEKGSNFDGYYLTQERYYIRKGDNRPAITNLSKSSLLKILYDQSDKLTVRLPNRQLTANEVINALTYYDSLTAAARITKPPLSADPVFTQFLHEQVKYPNQAWYGSVYGRVYVGFEVDSLGQVSTITTLSPENVGFGFGQEVKQALRRLAKVKPDYVGKYVLPVAFTYTNSSVRNSQNVPVNTLPADRYEGRTLLEELVVPVNASRTVTSIREVWGYYK